MVFFKKYRLELILGAGIILLYLITRLYNILSLPIFTDEAIYTRWSQIARQDASWRFISLTDGKQPMFVWLDMVFMKVISDPLLAGRLVSVFSGFFSAVGLFFLARELFKNRKIALLASLLYVLYPFSLVYDRMALYDSMVGAFAVWALYFEILLVRLVRLDIALLLGMILGGGMLTKTNAFLFAYLIPLLLILFDFREKNSRQRLLKLAGLSVVSVIIAYGFYSVLRLSPFFHIIAEKNALFVYPISEWIKHPFRFFWGNLKGMFDWLLTYVTIPLVAILVTTLIADYKKYTKEKIFLLLWFLLPFVALALFGKTLYPRFILFMTIPLLVLLAYILFFILSNLKNNIAKIVFLIMMFFLPIRADYYILSDFARAPIPYSDLEQFINSWPAGGGVRESVQFFKEKAEREKIFIGTQGTFGLMPYSMEIYLVDNPNVTIKGYWPISENVPQEVLDASKKMPTYLVFYQPCLACSGVGNAPSSWPVERIARYKQGIGDSYLSLYQVKP